MTRKGRGLAGTVVARMWAPSRALIVCLLLLQATVAGAWAQEDAYAEIDKGMDRLATVYRHIVQGYYTEVDPGELIEAAISGEHGMLGELDPYSQYLNEKAVEQLRIDTTGRFGGLGITVVLKDRVPTVVTVLHNTPAERAPLFPGDRIVKIDGTQTEGLSLDETVSRLRGEPGSSVRIEVEREGESSALVFSIVREDIKVDSVAFADTVEGGIGYLSMAYTRFSDTTDEEVDQALRSLRAKGATGIALDLRGNPGGLLPQAIKVANKFLGKSRLIVSTKGRANDQSRDYLATDEALVPDLPLAVLVDGSSASASEIVAGAIQDSDRGLIVGTNSFGKGSVQTVIDIDRETKLKLTTALYYTPSGRSIHKPSNGMGSGISVTIGGRSLPLYDVFETARDAGSPEAVNQALVERYNLTEVDVETLLSMDVAEMVSRTMQSSAGQDSAAPDRRSFSTAKGRSVFGGGGIVPDVVIEQTVPPFAEQLERRRLFFAFAVHYAASHPGVKTVGGATDAAAWDQHYAVDGAVISEFKIYLADPQRRFSYESAAEQELKSLKEVVSRESGYGAGTDALLRKLSEELAQKDSADFEESIPYIKGAIKRELAARFWGNDARVRAGVALDRQLSAAVALLRDPVLYAERIGRTGPDGRK